MSTQFEELLKSVQAVADENETMAKAIPQDGVPSDGGEAGDDDETIESASGEADAGGAAADADDKPVMAKSFQYVDDAGNEQEAVDATELIKSLMAHQESTDGVLAKALTTFTGTIKTQGEMIKSLAAQVQAMAAQGRGRKTMLNVVEKPDAATLAKSLEASKPAVMAPHEILAKCLSAQKAGALTGHDVARAEISINSGVALPADIIARIK